MNSIDIVIPCAGRAADLKRLLASIHAHCERLLVACVATITVTDDRPTKELKRALEAEFPSVTYVHGPARGPASNRNHGASHGAAEWILFLDDDCYLDGDLLKAYLAQVVRTPDCDVLEGAIHPIGLRPNGNHHAPLNLQGGCLWSCNMLIRRQTFESIGGFDEQFPFACMEDVDLRERLLAAGARVGFAPDAVVFHPWRSISEREVTRQIISHAIYARKYPAFVSNWTALHLLRSLKGRLRLYATGRPGSIPINKFRTVAYDMVAPIAVYAVVRWAVLREVIWRRYQNQAKPV